MPAVLLALPLLAGAALPHAQGICTDSYRVMRGDTLYSIARLCRSSVAAMARANRLADARTIEVGQRLVIPGRDRSIGSFHRAVRPVPAPEPRGSPPEARGYRMERGDTLYSLARWAAVSLRALLAANPGIDPRKIEIGDLVRLPEGARDPAPAKARERGTARRPAPPPPRRSRPEQAAPPPPPPTPDDDEDEPDDMSDEPDVPGM